MVFEIKNEYKFITTEKFDTIIKFIKDGEVLSTQVINHPIIPPSESCIIDLFHFNIGDKIGDFNQIEFSFVLNKNTECYEAGMEVAWEQFEFKIQTEKLYSESKEYCNLFSKNKKNNCIEDYTIKSKPNNLKIKNISERYLITGSKFEVSVCKKTGNILLEIKKDPNLDKSYSMEVCSASIKDFKKKKFLILKIQEKLKKKLAYGNGVIGPKIILEADCINICFYIKDRLLGGSFFQIYKIFDSGRIYCNYSCQGGRSSKNFIANINIISHIKEVNWYGRGPYKSYPWAKSGMKYGKFEIMSNEDNSNFGRISDVKKIDFLLEDGVYNSVKFMSEVDIVIDNNSILENLNKVPLAIKILSDQKLELKKSNIMYYEKNNFKKNNNKELEFIIELGSN